MDYYEAVVLHYLRSDRALFLNSECCIQLKPGNPDTSGPHWYCDAVALDMKHSTIFLCEISYGRGLGPLKRRLNEWNVHWADLRDALFRDSHLDRAWPVRPWLFVPEESVRFLLRHFEDISANGTLNFTPRITPLEMTQPWLFPSWNRVCEKPKPEWIPEEMRN
jgi:hypothetical protein